MRRAISGVVEILKASDGAASELALRKPRAAECIKAEDRGAPDITRRRGMDKSSFFLTRPNERALIALLTGSGSPFRVSPIG